MAASASADIILYDESADGDLPYQVALTDFGTLTPGSYLISGTLDGGTGPGHVEGPDESDGFVFATNEGYSFDVAAFSGNDGLLTIRPGVVFNELVTGVQPELVADAPAGDYSVNFAPSGNAGALSYSFRINVVPEPGSALALGAGIILLVSRRPRTAEPTRCS